jgi:hypothetical protein
VVAPERASGIDDYLRPGGRGIITHAGKIPHEDAIKKADLEFEEYRRQQLAAASQVEKDFEAAVKQLPKPKTKPKKLK